MAIEQKTQQKFTYKYTFEAFGKADYLYTTYENWDTVQAKLRRASGCCTAKLHTREVANPTPVEYADKCFLAIKKKARR